LKTLIYLSAAICMGCSPPTHEVTAYLTVNNQSRHYVRGILTVAENGTGERCDPNEKDLIVATAPASAADGRMTLDCEGWTTSFLAVEVERQDDQRGWKYSVDYPLAEADLPAEVFVRIAGQEIRKMSVSENDFLHGGALDYSAYLPGTLQVTRFWTGDPRYPDVDTFLRIQYTTGDSAVEAAEIGLAEDQLTLAERSELPQKFRLSYGAGSLEEGESIRRTITCTEAQCI
jgi:hypothetical protein